MTDNCFSDFLDLSADEGRGQDTFSPSDSDGDSSFIYNTPTSVENHAFRTLICCGCGHSIRIPISCGNRFCPICSVGRLSRVRKRIKWLIDNHVKYNLYSLKHLTLTIPNQKNLAKMIKHLTKSFRRLRQRAFWKNNVKGGAYVIEVTGRPGNWHAHIHAIVQSRYMPFDQLLSLWIKCSGGRGVYIQRIPASVAANYLTKYLTKSTDMPEQVALEVSTAIKGMRWFSPFGNWYHINLDYVQPKPGCPKCHGHDWMPLEMIIGQSDEVEYCCSIIPKIDLRSKQP